MFFPQAPVMCKWSISTEVQELSSPFSAFGTIHDTTITSAA